jgi:hypothetical protein
VEKPLRSLQNSLGQHTPKSKPGTPLLRVGHEKIPPPKKNARMIIGNDLVMDEKK